jgi:hypothetical protein
MSQQGLRQASVRTVSSSVLDYNGDWMAMWDALSIPAGTFNERMLLYINVKLSTTYTELNGAMAALAASVGASDFGSIGTIDLATTVATLTLVEDGLEESPTPFFTISSTAAGTLYFDLHSVNTPSPAYGAGDQGFVTQAISAGTTVFSLDLSSLAGLTGYPHVSVVNGAGRSNVLVLQIITVPTTGPTDGLLLEDGASFYLQEDGTSYLTQESA